MPQFGRPISDVSTGSWTTAPLWSKLDEAVADDADFARSPDNANTTAEVALSAVTDPGGDTGHIVRVRARKSASGGNDRTLVFQLYQGAVQISVSSPITMTASFQNLALNLSSGSAASITDYGALRVRLVAGGTTGGSAANRRSVDVSFVELEVPALNVVGTVAVDDLPITGAAVGAPIPAAGTVTAGTVPLAGTVVGASHPTAVDPFAYWRSGDATTGLPGSALNRSFQAWRRGEPARTLTADVAPTIAAGVVATAPAIPVTGTSVTATGAALGTVAADDLPLTGTAIAAVAASVGAVTASALPLVGTTTGGLGAIAATGTVTAGTRAVVGGAVVISGGAGGFDFDWFRAGEPLRAAARRNAGGFDHWRAGGAIGALTRAEEAGPTGHVAPRTVALTGTAVIGLATSPNDGIVAADALPLSGTTIAATGPTLAVVAAAALPLAGTTTGAQAAGPGLGTVRDGAVHLSGSLPEFYGSALFGSGRYGGVPGTTVGAAGGNTGAVLPGTRSLAGNVVVGRHPVSAVVDRREVATIGQAVAAAWGATGVVVVGATLRLDSAPHVGALVTALGDVVANDVAVSGTPVVGEIPPAAEGNVQAGVVASIGADVAATFGANGAVATSALTLAGTGAEGAVGGYASVLVGVVGTSGRAVQGVTSGPGTVAAGTVVATGVAGVIGLPGTLVLANVVPSAVILTGRPVVARAISPNRPVGRLGIGISAAVETGFTLGSLAFGVLGGDMLGSQIVQLSMTPPRGRIGVTLAPTGRLG
jgi:hypothetical protein